MAPAGQLRARICQIRQVFRDDPTRRPVFAGRNWEMPTVPAATCLSENLPLERGAKPVQRTAGGRFARHCCVPNQRKSAPRSICDYVALARAVRHWRAHNNSGSNLCLLQRLRSARSDTRCDSRGEKGTDQRKWSEQVARPGESQAVFLAPAPSATTANKPLIYRFRQSECSLRHVARRQHPPRSVLTEVNAAANRARPRGCARRSA